MSASTQEDLQVIRGAANIANAIRTELVHRGLRQEEIALQWLPDPRFVPLPDAPELKAERADSGGSVQQMFSRAELENSSEQPAPQSVLAKINLVVESLQAGLP